MRNRYLFRIRENRNGQDCLVEYLFVFVDAKDDFFEDISEKMEEDIYRRSGFNYVLNEASFEKVSEMMNCSPAEVLKRILEFSDVSILSVNLVSDVLESIKRLENFMIFCEKNSNGYGIFEEYMSYIKQAYFDVKESFNESFFNTEFVKTLGVEIRRNVEDDGGYKILKKKIS